MKDNLQLDSIYDDLEKAIEEGMDEVMDFAQEKLEEKTPEDKKDLVQGYEKQAIKKQGTLITGSIVNKVPHGIFVEYGLSKEEGLPGGKKFNYHKPKGSVFYRWVGARMVTRTYDQDQWEMFDILEDKINKVWV